VSILCFTRSYVNPNRLYGHRNDGDLGKVVSYIVECDDRLIGFITLSIRILG
jgi:hypothetical protein